MGDDDRPPIGHRIRAERQAQRLTLMQLADKAGLTKGFLSKVERDQAAPSVASLLRLCDALGISPGELFDGSHDQELVRAGAYPAIGFGGQGMAESLLTPFRERRLQVIHSVIEPEGGSGDETYELPVDVEFVFVVAGRIALVVDGQHHELAAGDAITFLPSAPHAFHNPSGHETAEVLWVLAPALPLTGEPEESEVEWR
jgi:transcriptional regulator with XRE-family HTH domain